MPPLLKLENVSIVFGGLTAVESINFEVEKGAIVSLIGPNGAGKSTVFNIVSGIYSPTAGSVYFREKDITGEKAYKITDYGIARTFQNIRLFRNLSTIDNVRIGCHTVSKSGYMGAILRTRGVKEEERRISERTREALSVVRLEAKGDDLARNLSYGEQRKLEIARALASSPDLLLLDEPAAGMNMAEKQDLMDMIKSIQDMGITILLVEHDMKFVMGISDYIIVLNYGQIIASGTPEAVQNDPVVIEAYLGKEAD